MKHLLTCTFSTVTLAGHRDLVWNWPRETGAFFFLGVEQAEPDDFGSRDQAGASDLHGLDVTIAQHALYGRSADADHPHELVDAIPDAINAAVDDDVILMFDL